VRVLFIEVIRGKYYVESLADKLNVRPCVCVCACDIGWI